jgi:hypothetical protein
MSVEFLRGCAWAEPTVDGDESGIHCGEYRYPGTSRAEVRAYLPPPLVSGDIESYDSR